MSEHKLVDWDGFLSKLSGKFDANHAKLKEELDEALEAISGEGASDPALLQAYQSKLSEYTLFRNAQSNTIKVYKDVGSAIISNFR